MVRITVITLRLLLIAMFAYSGYSKLSDPADFQRTLAKYQLFSEGIIPYLTYYVPILELSLSLALILPFTYKPALFCNLLLFIVFTVALSTLVARGIDADCGCLGSLGSTPKTAIIRNLILMTAVIFLIIQTKKLKSGKIDDSPLYE